MYLLDNARPSSLRAGIEKIDFFNIILVRDFKGINYTLFIWRLIEIEDEETYNPSFHFYVATVYKEDEFMHNYVNTSIPNYRTEMHILVNEIIGKPTKHWKETILGLENISRLPDMDKVDDSIFNLNILFNIDISFFDFQNEYKNFNLDIEEKESRSTVC